MRDTINVQLAPGWQTIALEDLSGLPAGLLDAAGDTVRYVAAAVPATRTYAPNLVAVRTTLAPDEDPEEVLVGSARVMADSVPGMRMIDEFPAAGSPEGRRLRSGIYILDDEALTLFQVAWLDRSAEGTHLWAVTFTCATREFGAVSEQFLAMSDTLEVTA